jgi:hypothetical protein
MPKGFLEASGAAAGVGAGTGAGCETGVTSGVCACAVPATPASNIVMAILRISIALI